MKYTILYYLAVIRQYQVLIGVAVNIWLAVAFHGVTCPRTSTHGFLSSVSLLGALMVKSVTSTLRYGLLLPFWFAMWFYILVILPLICYCKKP